MEKERVEKIKAETKTLAKEIEKELANLGLGRENVESKLLQILRNGASPEDKQKAKRVLGLAWKIVLVTHPHQPLGLVGACRSGTGRPGRFPPLLVWGKPVVK